MRTGKDLSCPQNQRRPRTSRRDAAISPVAPCWPIRPGNSPTVQARWRQSTRGSPDTPRSPWMKSPRYRLPRPVAEQAHLYLWVPNALLQEGLDTMAAWGFTYKTKLGLAQDSKGRRSRRAGRRVLFPQHDRARPVWRTRFIEDTGPRQAPGEHHQVAQARTLSKAGRAIRRHRGVLSRTFSGNCSPVAGAASNGPPGATKVTSTNRIGRPTPTTAPRDGPGPTAVEKTPNRQRGRLRRRRSAEAIWRARAWRCWLPG